MNRYKIRIVTDEETYHLATQADSEADAISDAIGIVKSRYGESVSEDDVTLTVKL